MSESSKQFSSMEYYTPEQRAYLSQRQTLLGQERVTQILSEWNTLRVEFSLACNQQIDPADARIQTLAKQVSALKKELIGDAFRFEEVIERGARDLLALDPEEGKLMMYILEAMNLLG